MTTHLNIFNKTQKVPTSKGDGFNGFMQSFGNVISSVTSTITSGLKQIFEFTGLKKLTHNIMTAFGFMKQDNLASNTPINDSPHSLTVTDVIKNVSAFTPIGGLVKGGEALINAGKALIADKAPSIAGNDIETKLNNIVKRSTPTQELPSDPERGMKF